MGKNGQSETKNPHEEHEKELVHGDADSSASRVRKPFMRDRGSLKKTQKTKQALAVDCLMCSCDTDDI
jgi:hypothetical protein